MRHVNDGKLVTYFRTRESSGSVVCYQIDMWEISVPGNVVYDSVTAF